MQVTEAARFDREMFQLKSAWCKLPSDHAVADAEYDIAKELREKNASSEQEVNRLEDVLFVARPANALSEGGGNLYCFRDAEDTALARAMLKLVEYGIASANQIVIRNGLPEGENVIVSDLSRFDETPEIRLRDWPSSLIRGPRRCPSR